MIPYLISRRQLCYDISLHSDIEQTKEVFPRIKDTRVEPVKNQDHILSFGFPSCPIISRQGPEIILSDMEWSVDPLYEKDPAQRKKKRISMADMQSERVLGDKRSYWYRLRHNRCLIPVSGTYEHRSVPGFANKIPYYIYPKGRDIQFLPGLYQINESVGPNGEKIQLASFGMLTRSANELMANIHNDGQFKHRMPLFLTPELEEFWLSENFSDEDMQAVFDYMLPSQALDCHTVFSVRGKAPRPDGKAKYEYWRFDNLPPLGSDQMPQTQLTLF